jgi:glycosyltransferase involved in cell wall biosynthesis
LSLRVLHVDTARGWRGGQNQVLLTAEGMAKGGHVVSVACRAGGMLEARARQASLAVRPVPFRGDLWPPAVTSLAGILRADRPDLLLLHDPHAVAGGLVARRLARIVPVVAVRRVDFPLRGALSRAKYRACDRVIAVSEAIRGVLERDGVSSSRLRVVYEGVPDRGKGPGGAREARLALGVPDGAPIVGNVAALTAHKDHATLLEAAALVLRARPDTRFVILGEGELRPALEAQRRALGLEDRVLLPGFRSDLDRLLPAFDVFCLSSRMEGLGTSLLDAMSFGLPVVATAAGGIPEAVEDGVTGRLVPPRAPEPLATALLELLGNEARGRAMGEAGRARFLARFSSDRMVAETLHACRDLA